MNWRLTGDGQEISSGADGSAWAWELVSEDESERRTVIIEISGTAMAASSVHHRVDAARRSDGQTEIQRVLEWQEPPRKIVLHSESTAPDMDGGIPGPDLAEIIELTDWFGERGITLVFSARGTYGAGTYGAGTYGGSSLGGGGVIATKHAANLIDPESDKLVSRFEAPSRLAAARDAHQWWIENRQQAQTITPDGIPSQGSVVAPRISPEQQEELNRRQIHLVINGPSHEGPDTGYVIEAWTDDTELVGLSVGQTAGDAWLTLYDDLFSQ